MTTPFYAVSTKGDMRVATAKQRFLAHYNEGRYDKALAVAEGYIRSGLNSSDLYLDAAACCVYLAKWDDAIAYAKRSLTLNPNECAALDALSHAYGGQASMERCQQGRGSRFGSKRPERFRKGAD